MQGNVHRIEIVGLAGAGKSTLAQALLARHPDWRMAETMHARAPSHVPYFVHGAPAVARLLARGLRRPWVSWDEIKFYVYASEWHRYLDGRPEHRSSVTLFDQGPLFALARLLWGGSAVTSTPWFDSWKRETVARWAHELDAVVELSAPDHVLSERINGREKRHAAKEKSARDTAAILASHRRAYAEVLANVERTGSVGLMRFDTSKRPLEQIADEISGLLASNPSMALDGMGSDEQRTSRATRAAARDHVERLGSNG